MDTHIIEKLMNQSLKGEITFPEVVMQLANYGIERYHVDLVGLQKLSYDIHGNHAASSFYLEIRPDIPNIFNALTIKQTVQDIQHKRIDYKTFLKHIMEAGCCHYEVFIFGKKVIYFGRDGSHHIEHFPQK